MGGRRRATWTAAAALTCAAIGPSAAAGQVSPGPEVQPAGKNDAGGFRNVLPGGQGETVNAAEFAASQVAGEPPESFTDQLPLYNGILYEAPSLDRPDLDEFFKSAAFGVPSSQIDPLATERPRSGTTIIRDERFQVPHVYGETRGDTMFGAGYATATDRLFLMDVLRHTGRAELTELIGAGEGNSTVEMDAAQLKIADYNERELEGMIDEAAASAGKEGERIRRDLLAYVDGINEYIRDARTNPAKMPVEYAALGYPEGPELWKPTDTVAVASLIGGIFGRGGGSEAIVSQALQAARDRFGQGDGRAVFEDFRQEDDPEAPITTTRRFPFDDPGAADPDSVAVPDEGSIEDEDVVQGGSSPAKPPDGSSGSAAPGEAPLEGLRGLRFPDRQSNALLIPGKRSASGSPIAVMGPQVGYFSPQILLELDLHGPGIDARGAAFPGISLYVLLGRARDYAWSATTATSDNVDEFVERLCEPDGSQPTMNSNHYRYKGDCRRFETRRRHLRTRPNTSDPVPREFELEGKRSVHGPIQARATVDGDPVAIAEARSTYFHELESARAFKRLNGNEVDDARDFQKTMNFVNFAFNWFYTDDRDVTYFTSGWYPRRADGTDPSLPALGTGKWDWQGFDPDTFLSDRMSFGEKPKSTNPGRGYLVNWNNKQAPGWRAADDNTVYSSVHRSERLEDRVRDELRGGGEVSLTELTQIMETGATIDLRGQEVYPVLREAIGDPGGDQDAARLLEILDEWGDEEFHRRDIEPGPDGDNVLEHSPAVALMDAWWPLLVEGMFEPALGGGLMDRITDFTEVGSPPDAGGSSFFTGWWGYVEKDLRAQLGEDVEGPLSRPYCGRDDQGQGSFSDCRELLIETLKQAEQDAEARYGTDLEDIERPATCDEDPEHPRDCDQIEFTTAGAIGTDPIHWQDRPTFQQVVQVEGSVPHGDGGDGPGGGGGGGAPGGGTSPGGGTGGTGGTGADDGSATLSDATAGGGASAGSGDRAGSLPFTGLSLGLLILAALVLLSGGVALRRRFDG